MAVKSTDQITIIDVTDAYSVILTSEAYTFVGGINGAAAGASCSTQAVAYCGTNSCTKVSIDQTKITCPTGISAVVTGNDTANPTITFTTTALVSEACEATIPVVVDGITVNKKFSFAVAKTGATGATGENGTSVTVSSTSVKYQYGASGSTKPTGTWSTEVPTEQAGKYLWTQTIVTYSDGKTTESYSVSYNGVGVTSTAVTYAVSDNGTTAPTSGWGGTIPTVQAGKYLWTKTVTTYTDGNSTDSYSVAYNAVDGADAITLTITSSHGTIFKNNSGSTTLTAHVFLGAVEQTINDNGVCGTLGTVKWYKGDATTGTAGKSITVSAADITNTVVYTAQLE